MGKKVKQELNKLNLYITLSLFANIDGITKVSFSPAVFLSLGSVSFLFLHHRRATFVDPHTWIDFWAYFTFDTLIEAPYVNRHMKRDIVPITREY